MGFEDRLAPRHGVVVKESSDRNKLEGKYILHQYDGYCFSILRENPEQNLVYETVIPDAGRSRIFALGLVELLNSQGSEFGESSDSDSR